MKIIQNLLELLLEDETNDENELLLEAIGNLKAIDKKFLPALKVHKQVISSRTGKTAYEKRKSLTVAVGDNSPFSTKNYPSAGPAMTQFDTDPGAQVLVVSVDEGAAGGFQVMLVVKTTGTTNKIFSIDYGFLRQALKPNQQEIETLENLKVSRNLISTASSNGIRDTRDVSSADIGKIMNAALKMFKARDMKFSFTVLSTDVDRKQKASDRQAARKGSIPKFRSSEANERYEQLLKRDLKVRLDKFKSSKSEKYDTPEALLKALLDQGYLDKFTFGEQTYDLYDDRVNFRNLRNKKENNWSSDESYIEYKINEKTDAYKEEAKRINDSWRLATKDAKQNGTEADYHEITKNTPPGRIKIMLELKGGAIVPKEIKYEAGNFF